MNVLQHLRVPRLHLWMLHDALLLRMQWLVPSVVLKMELMHLIPEVINRVRFSIRHIIHMQYRVKIRVSYTYVLYYAHICNI